MISEAAGSASCWPIWLVVAAAGLGAQVLKLLLYSLARRRLALTAFAQSNGLPSLPAVVTSCLLVTVALGSGWQSAETSFALVFAVLVLHDTVKLSGMADRQRQALVGLLTNRGGADNLAGRASDLLDPRSHHPAHVLAGLVLGGLFALAFACAQR